MVSLRDCPFCAEPIAADIEACPHCSSAIRLQRPPRAIDRIAAERSQTQRTAAASMWLAAGITGGLLSGLLGYVLFEIMIGSAEQNVGAIIAGGLTGLLAVLLASNSKTSNAAWAKAMLCTGELCFSLPLAVIVQAGAKISEGLSSHPITGPATDWTALGTIVGGGIGYGIAVSIAAVIGLFGGLIFVSMAMFIAASSSEGKAA